MVIEIGVTNWKETHCPQLAIWINCCMILIKIAKKVLFVQITY